MGAVTETTFDAAWFTAGIRIYQSDNAIIQDVTVNNVFNAAVAFQALDNGRAYRCTANVTWPMQSYTQWQIIWVNTTGGGCEDCTVNG